ncbi:hypothetical protein O1611_g567 [Lasiodiplodia mahajangana]|uniref:Uncharacterized protein n=1 Tax=Lasiodiplodia mahajangana TaxID=1108764 RepID=A0ACC2JZU4_9PEZI|nr:hypothetical protein O1611_g567 [Lasiodiplodia mahajangana]
MSEIRDRHPLNHDQDGTLNSLYEDIEQHMELRDDSSARFLPAGCLDKLLTKEAIRSALDIRSSKHSDVGKLVDFVRDEAKRVFATLVWIEKESLIFEFYRAGFTDEMLPVIKLGKILLSSKPQFSKQARTAFSSPKCNSPFITKFHDSQWIFLSPVFGKNQFRYGDLKKYHMPFIEKTITSGGQFGEVARCIVHRDHLKVGVNAAEREAFMLEKMKQFPHEHLIQIIAYYEIGEQKYFLFPWAKYGNLRNYWQSNDPSLSHDNLTWFFSQLAGLAGAIQQLHDKGGCRHGDIKPQNILCFEGTGPGTTSYQVRLVIADVGLARVHEDATLLRQGVTTTKSYTVMYSGPEVEPNDKPRSRLYDVWSMGCTYLEFVIWLLFGQAGLNQFQEAIGGISQRGTFYDFQPGRNSTPRVHPTVSYLIKHIRNDPRCSDNTALRRLVDLISTRLLIVPLPMAPPKLSGSTSFPSDPKPDHHPKILVRGPTFRPVASDDGPVRATATEMYDVLTRIKEDILSKRHKIIGEPTATVELPQYNSTLELPSPSVGALNVGVRNLQAVSQPWQRRPVDKVANSPELNDDWEYIPDNDLGGEVFEQPNSSPTLLARGQASTLCSRCSSLSLWSASCAFADTLRGLEQKMNYCALCRLLHSQCIQANMFQNGKLLRFSRASSYLKIDGYEQPIVSLYMASKGRNPYMQGLQIGDPKLVSPGGAAHISLMIKWIDGCNQHKCYPRDITFFPTRALDVTSSETVRLVNNAELPQGTAKYIALSHRWGPPTQHRAFCTERKDVEGGKERIIKTSTLPKTFQDAVQITRGLGIPYLWIDSLCIIQDDKDDWGRESQLMEQVFSSAYCTLAATSASGFDDGFLKPRRDRQYVTMRGPGNDAPLYYVCEPIDDFHRHVDQSELNSRGWVLQERALSRRTIYLTETQTYWECGKGVRCETLTKMKNQKASFLGDSNFPRSAEDYVKGKKIKLIQSLYERYSTMALTFSGDRPIAIRGLEARLMHTFGGIAKYGIFRLYLHRCLLWKKSENNMKPIVPYPGEEIPSWSWMAYEGGIRYIDAPGSDVDWMDDLKWPISFPKVEDISSRGSTQQSKDDEKLLLEIEAPVWGLVEPRAEDMTLDDDTPLDANLSKCVIVGISKRPTEPERKKYYILVVQKVLVSGNEVWKRRGVGVVQPQYIALNGPKTVIRMT